MDLPAPAPTSAPLLALVPANGGKRRAVEHPSNPDVKGYAGFPLSQGEPKDTLEFKILRDPVDQYPWHWEVRWEDQAADNQATEGETGAEPIVNVKVIIPSKRPDGEIWMRQGDARAYRIKVWREGVLVHDEREWVGTVDLVTPHAVEAKP
jgi:hypothetical protein